MELLQIIIFTLKLFALTSAIVVLISYFIFKLKDRVRIKPYMKPTVVEAASLAIQSGLTIEKKYEKKPKHFKILNEENSFLKERQIRLEKSNPIKFIQEEYNFNKKNISKENFNIYDYYSNSNFEPMHKIKL